MEIIDPNFKTDGEAPKQLCKATRKFLMLRLICHRPKEHEGEHAMIISWKKRKEEKYAQ